MKERVGCLGGDYAIESEIGHGTCVRITVPIDEPNAAHDPQIDRIAP